MLQREPKKIVILEPDHTRRDFLRSVLESDSGLAFCFDKVEACFDNLSRLNADLILVGGIAEPGLLRFINAHNATDCRLPSLVMTRDQAVKTYLERGGGNQIQAKDIPLDPDGIHRSIQQLLQECHDGQLENGQPFIVGCSPGINSIKKILPNLTNSRECVIIEGEVGTGKEMIARAIHGGHDKSDVFIKISAQDLQSKRGGRGISDSRRQTIQQHASLSDGCTATIFIKELGYLPDAMQAELLNLFDNIQTGKNNSKRLRVIASTRVGADFLQTERRFRTDLFYRLNVINLKIEPLRKRKEDIPLLADYFFYRYCKLLERSFFELPQETLDHFMDYKWPGNSAELQSVVKRMVVDGNDGKFLKLIQQKHRDVSPPLPGILSDGKSAVYDMLESRSYLKLAEQKPLKEICSDFMTKIERKVMKKALEATNWNRKKAAELLNISYKSMLNKIKEYGLA